MPCSSLEGFSLPLTAEVGVEDGLHSCMVKKICRVFVLRAKTRFDQDGVSFALQDEIINLAARRFARNYIVDETDEEKEHRLPTLPQAMRLDQETIKVYSQNYLLRCSDRQQELCTSRITLSKKPEGGDISLHTHRS